MGQRRKSRELALQILFQVDVAHESPEEALRLFYESFEAPIELRPFAEDIVNGVSLHRLDIDQMIRSTSQHWRVERMPVVDRNVIRIALYEMLYRTDIPAKVSINEAIDLAKHFGTEESGAFVNGILDRILARLPAETASKIEQAS
jgi:N utilization substance protein B